MSTSPINKLLIPRPTNDNDGYEEVAIFFYSEDDGETGVWEWMYSLYRANGEFISRKTGTTGLLNPRVKVQFLHRALIADRTLGAFIPGIEHWYHPGEGPNAGWAYRQRQRLDRAR